MADFGTRKDEISLMALGTILLRHRWRIVRMAALGATLGLLWAWSKPPMYSGFASFVSVASDPSRSGLASLAGQFGVAIPTTSASVSPEFYASLVHSRALLAPIVHDTVRVAEMGGRQVPVLDLLDPPEDETAPAEREDVAVKALRRMVEVSTTKSTGVVGVTVRSEWRSVSLAIVSTLVNGINEYNLRTRQGQGTAERKFVEGRLQIAAVDLRRAEDRLSSFLQANRNIGNAPDRIIERDRLEREVGFRQQVLTAMTQSHEDARLREVRDTPVIAIVEPPWAPVRSDPRGRLAALLFGGVAAGAIASIIAVARELTRRRRLEGDPDADEFLGTLRDVRTQMFSFGRRGAR